MPMLAAKVFELPWGAQILLAASLGGVSPLSLAGSLHYCWLLGGITLAWVLFERRRFRRHRAGRRRRIILRLRPLRGAK